MRESPPRWGGSAGASDAPPCAPRSRTSSSTSSRTAASFTLGTRLSGIDLALTAVSHLWGRRPFAATLVAYLPTPQRSITMPDRQGQERQGNRQGGNPPPSNPNDP